MLLTDGTVLVQGYQGQDWYKLTPDNTGSYVNGTWTQLASLASNYDPYAMAEAVLADGRVLIEGGEYNFGSFSFTNLGAVYDPLANTWTPLTPPAGWDYIGDSPCAVLPNGHFIIGRKFDMQMAELDPAHHDLDRAGLVRQERLERRRRLDAAARRHAADGRRSEQPQLGALHSFAAALGLRRQHRRQPARSAGSRLHPLRWRSVLPSGRNRQRSPASRWIGLRHRCDALRVRAPVTPPSIVPDATPNRSRHVDCRARTSRTATAPTITGRCCCPTARCWWKAASPDGFYEWDGTNFTATLSSFGGTSDHSAERPGAGWRHRRSTRPAAAGCRSGRRSSLSLPRSVTRGQTYHVIGRQFNGWSQAASFGDEFQTATNYPLVRITNIATGHVFYARTHDHSTMGVVTRSTPTYTHFDVPRGHGDGSRASWMVVANGIRSNAMNITVN